MTLHERFHRIMRFQPVDRLPYVEFRNLSWVQTHRWKDQGLPLECNPYEAFGFDEASNHLATGWNNGGRGLEHVEIDLYALPRFDPRPVREEGEYHYTFDIRTGVTIKRLRARCRTDLSVKTVADPPVKTRLDWPEYKKRFDPATPGRYPRIKQYEHHLPIYPLDYPETWDQAVRDMASATHLVTIGMHTGYNFVANAIGVDRLFEAVIDNPPWVREMMDHFAHFAREAQRKAIETAPIDFVLLSHNHYDHLDAPTLKELGPEVTYYVPLGIKRWMESRGRY